MFSALINIFKIAELRQRIFFTLGLIFICRLIAAVPLPGVDAAAIRDFFAAGASSDGGLVGMFNMFSGGALLQCSIGALGIMPYISASIIMQLMTAVIPHLEKLSREGDVGRQKITQYTRYLTVVLCSVQSIGIAIALKSGNFLGTNLPSSIVTMNSAISFALLTMITMVAASLLIMWIGEQITDRGIGNGVSLIITVNIISDLPKAISMLIEKMHPVDGMAEIGWFHLSLMLVIFFAVVLFVVAITQAQQKVPVQFAKRMVGRRTMQGQTQHLPLRVNFSGVMPIIFASAILAIPTFVLNLFPWEWSHKVASSFSSEGKLYYVFYGSMILFFSYFWVATQFNPIQIADNLKKQGGYVPGIRPGRATAEYLDHTMARLTLAGAVFLTMIALFPMLITKHLNIPILISRFMGGTSMLIIVGVMLDTMRQIESHLLMRHYDGFLKKGKIRGRR